MSAATKQTVKAMTSDEFLVWSLTQANRYELVDGIPVRLQAERNRHTRVKGRVFRAFGDAIDRAGMPCEAWTDGVSVRVNELRVREPDVVVTCGIEQDPDGLALEGAVIVVEVLSPTNGNTDKLEKLAEYGSVPGLRHYLIVHPTDRYVIHHQFEDGLTHTRIVRDGAMTLDPPGLTVPVAEFFPVQGG